ncbi:MAG: thioredoxin family protein [Maribacter sp.]
MESIVLDNISKTTRQLVQQGISNTMSYLEYRDLVNTLSAEGKSTGLEQTDTLTDYTNLNNRRMRRLDKTLKINDSIIGKIKSIDKKVTWLVLTESWCGDAAQTLPVINKVAELNSNISLKIILRDSNVDLMKRFLTNNAMSIPKLIMVNESMGEVIGEWGPRPSIATQMVVDYKNDYGTLTPEFKEDLQIWYNNDKGQNTLKDLLELLSLE